MMMLGACASSSRYVLAPLPPDAQALPAFSDGVPRMLLWPVEIAFKTNGAETSCEVRYRVSCPDSIADGARAANTVGNELFFSEDSVRITAGQRTLERYVPDQPWPTVQYSPSYIVAETKGDGETTFDLLAAYSYRRAINLGRTCELRMNVARLNAALNPNHIIAAHSTDAESDQWRRWRLTTCP